VTRPTLLVDVAIAVLIGALVLLLSPGLAIAAIIALGIVLVCGITLLWGVMRTRRRRRRGEWQ
jgi:ABC-type bacteriocin/lantibiotic exporter with double-glycine peptidase domain